MTNSNGKFIWKFSTICWTFLIIYIHQVSARQSERSRWGEQGLPFTLPASRVVQQKWSTSQIQILNFECQAWRDQSDGVATSISFRSRQGLGIQEVYPPRFSPRRSKRSLTRGQINYFLWGECRSSVTMTVLCVLSSLLCTRSERERPARDFVTFFFLFSFNFRFRFFSSINTLIGEIYWSRVELLRHELK